MRWLSRHTPSKSTLWIFVCAPCAFGTLWTLRVVWGNTVSCTCLQGMVKGHYVLGIWSHTTQHSQQNCWMFTWNDAVACCADKKSHKRMIVFSYLFHHNCKVKDETHFIIHQHAYLCIKICVWHLKYCRATLWQKYIFMVRFSYTSEPGKKKLYTGSLMTYRPHFKAKIHNLKKWKVYYHEQTK